MYRNNIKILINWKLSKNRKPLIFLGARQVGKTWLIKEFGKTQYRQTLYINFEVESHLQDIFLKNLDPMRLISEFEFLFNMRITPEDTLIVFDEIQTAARGITSLKYFQENAPEYHIIAAGSLLGVQIHPGESFPVGKVDFLRLFPMSFYEFLLAMGETGLVRILDEKLWDYSPTLAVKFTEFLRYYFYIGGMPEVVAAFAENRDWQAARRVQKKILLSYESDFSKYAPKEIFPRLKMVWDSIPIQLGKENKKFLYGAIKEGARAKDFELAIQWLVDSGLLHKVNDVSKPALPLNAYKELSAFKLYHNDVGLLGAMSGLKTKTVVLGDELFTEFKGSLSEQFVYQELRLNEELIINYHTFQRSKYEIDFLIQNEEDEIIPIEVKSGNSLHAYSFNVFCEKHKPAKAIRTSLANYKEESWLTNVPLYLIGRFF
jgi:predicted AAA+ superfamily ATPase